MSNRRFYEDSSEGSRRSAPAALRNREPIAEVLADWLPQRGLVLEVASGTGEHASYFARRFPLLDWQPSDTHPDALASIRSWQAEGPANLHAPIEVDATSADWPIKRADAVFNSNMAHISPWVASLGLIAGAARIVPTGGKLILYGPWLKDGIDPAPSNLAFDADLKRRDPEWGLRRVEAFEHAASEHFDLTEVRAMPANNLMLLFTRRGQST